MFPFLQISRGSELVVLRSQVIRHSYVGRHLRCHELLRALMDTRRVSSHVGDDLHIGPFMMVPIQRMERLWSQEQF